MAERQHQRTLFPDVQPRAARSPRRLPAPTLAPEVPPYSTRDCADYLGVDLDFIYDAIDCKDLKAEYMKKPGKSRGTWHVHHDDFVAFLRSINWKRIPGEGLRNR